MADLQSVQYSDKTFSLPSGSNDHVELTQAEYDALSEAEKNNGKVYFITDGQGGGDSGLTARVQALEDYDGLQFAVKCGTCALHPRTRKSFFP